MDQLPNAPIYLMEPGNPIIARWQQIFEMFAAQDKHSFSLTVPPDVVEEMQVAMLQELIVALQHYPELIEKFLFAIELKFEQIANSELYYEKDIWKTDPQYYRWFFTMGSFPLVLFFLRDRDARFYCLAGDFLANEKVIIQNIEGEKEALVTFEEKELEKICGRLFTACWLLHMYCHGSSFDPQQCIESILADYDLPISYEEIRKKYEEDVNNGVKLRANTR